MNLAALCLKALRSLLVPGMMGVLILSIAITLAALALMIVAISAAGAWAVGLLSEGSLLAPLLPWLSGFGATFIAWLLFPGITPLVISFFDQRICGMIEARDYPGAKPRPPAPFWPELLHDLGFTLKAVLLNILVLPLYLVPVLNLVLFYWLNGRLLGREYFVMVARRHMGTQEAEALHRQHSTSLTLAGAILTLLTTLPVVNLVAPLWGIAVMVHCFHALRKN